MGVGKGPLAGLLCDRLGARGVLEPGDNPFLSSFYQDPRRHAFQAQIFFLLSRYQQREQYLQEELFARGGVVSDFLFARDRIFAQLNLSRDELALYDKVYGLLGAQMPRPDLVVYLQARPEVLLGRARKRPEAQRLQRDYPERVVEAYADFFFHYTERPPRVVHTSETAFVE